MKTRSFLFLVLAAGVGGCAHPQEKVRPLPAWALQPSRPHAPPVTPRPRGGIRGRSEASDFVVAALQQTGLRFGTDGSVQALWGYLRTTHTALAPNASRPGDVVFFQTHAPLPAAITPAQACDAPDHVGIVADVDGDGRIVFVEARNGAVLRSFADPERPQERRDESGRVLNTFLRPKRTDDPDNTPNFAGEMLCAAVRPRG